MISESASASAWTVAPTITTGIGGGALALAELDRVEEASVEVVAALVGGRDHGLVAYLCACLPGRRQISSRHPSSSRPLRGGCAPKRL
jgi:hypothetical protein